MSAVRDETNQEISWAMFKDCFNFLLFNFLGFFVFVQQDIPEVSQFSIFAILKSTNNSEIAAVAHVFAVESF